MRGGQERAFAYELEVAPGQQRIACHPVLGNEEGVARELRLEALIGRVRAHALCRRLIDVKGAEVVLVVRPRLEDAGSGDVAGSGDYFAVYADLVFTTRHVGLWIEHQPSDRLPLDVVEGVVVLDVAVGVGVPVDDTVSLSVMLAPAQRV